MLCAFKRLLIWMLLAALPVQGLAAVSKAVCGPAHHQPPVVQSMHRMQPDDISQQGAHAGHAQEATHAVHQATAADDAGKKESGTYSTNYCSACAACCVGAAAPPSAAIVPSMAGTSSSKVAFQPLRMVSIVPAGLERPPKSSLV